uniref:L domain-like protein n=1 Tax=Helicotheca tamesis TaxID=374047 RepID=A0A7S2N1H4_9STRA|mmetsp:Transcript_7885/g.10825  ORF Transcript_7885/g.10825 Transcript_7885/m.10825 type:complete len:650 (+) Transcript_7885:202-2151(+)|eukprot:CAMPEP_0185730264 /NCGR_PEP_ID=MMETSP1171-20130828/9152_1 /TAXON_ID=374046 /ORGANISM="Helicotheca tamensis, Strain CCMP826" /LENGTH=649 /DNA_ID=CAMNT_0028399277 /DNA_START=132 /DNA_END=2084 /DNA_ORIENTATION=-
MMKTTEEGDEENFAAEEEPVHSLPTPEEMKTQAAITSHNESTDEKSGGGGKFKCAICVVAVCAIALIVSLSIFFAKKAGGDGDRKPMMMTPEERLAKSRAFLSTLPIEGSEEALADRNSPQSRALAWLARDDPLQLEIPSPPNRALDSSSSDSGSSGDSDSSDDSESEAKIAFDVHSQLFMNRYIMAVLYFSTGGEQWAFDFNFLTEKPTCRWMSMFQTSRGVQFAVGVVCDAEENIISLWIPNNAMSGELPFAEITQLTSLRMLAFQLNRDLTGTIPDSISQLTNLEMLALSDNQFSETLPASMEKMTSLASIMLDDNLLSGEITPIISLPNLEVVYLEDNFFDGQLDESYFSEAIELKHIDMSDNDFTGQLPSHWFEMPKLQVLDMHGNFNINGKIPDIPAEQTELLVLALHENALTGEIPPSISNLRKLRHLDVANNRLTGAVPEAISELTDLNYLFLGMNNYTENKIPTFLRNLTSLVDLSLKQMNLIGNIPEWIATDLETLRLLDLDGNRLKGNIPENFVDLKYLSFLLLNRNELTGLVPPGFRDLNLELLLLDRNSLIGDLDVICREDDPNPADVIIADCGGENPEITCTLDTCCYACCSDDDSDCNEQAWHGNKDPIWEASYQRFYYSFDDIMHWQIVPVGF